MSIRVTPSEELEVSFGSPPTKTLPAKKASNPEEIRAEIERARAQVVASAMALRREVTTRTDWREWVRRRPLPWIAAAFAVGWLLSRRRR